MEGCGASMSIGKFYRVDFLNLKIDKASNDAKTLLADVSAANSRRASAVQKRRCLRDRFFVLPIPTKAVAVAKLRAVHGCDSLTVLHQSASSTHRAYS